jgi:hypothetical protein
MVENRKKTERTLDSDYKNIDKQFKEQLIKTKVSGANRSGGLGVIRTVFEETYSLEDRVKGMDTEGDGAG